MAYLQELNEKFVNDIINRKEFVINDVYDQPITELDKEIAAFGKFQYRSYQNFAQNFMSPNTDIQRLFVKYGTGTGKTPLSIGIALQFINIFKKEKELDPKYIPNTILVIGFTKDLFKREILKYPEFGYISRDELMQLEKLKYNADIGTKEDEARYAEYLSSIRRRITNKKRQGFFQFYGYREFVNKIFISLLDINTLDEETIHKKIKDGEIKLNLDLIDTFKNSLVICDEIHEVYNSSDKNNWGVALQALFNYHGTDIRALFLSATPINHSPSEVIDLLNLLHNDSDIKKEDYFTSDKNLKAPEEATLEQIGDLFIARILFLEDANPKYFPSSKIEGEYIKGIPLLKFIRCYMSKFHHDTYREHFKGTLAHDAQYILDAALPNPDGPYGLFKTQETKNILTAASPKWLKENNIEVFDDKYGMVISGEFLNKDSLCNYSAKYYAMITDIHDHIKNRRGKIFIYHKYVRMTGVTFIKEILLRNGILAEFSDPADNTLDAVTGLTLIEHKKRAIKTEFKPVRFILIHSDIDKTSRDKSIERFNNPRNAFGDDIMILLGADIMKQSYDLKCVTLSMVMFRPDNISTLLQIFGRSKRQNSHKDLPPEYKNVNYRIYVSSMRDDLTYEEERYLDGIVDYKIIQKIEQRMHENAVDAYSNYGLIKNTFVEDTIGILPFEPKWKQSGAITHSTYDAYYNEKEVNTLIYIIKRLFTEISPVFTLADLVTMIKAPPFSLEFNPKLFDRDNINIAIMRVILKKSSDSINIAPMGNENYFIDKLFDPNDKIIIIRGVEYVIIENVGVNSKPENIYYVLTLYNRNTGIQLHYESPYRLLEQRKDLTININEYLSDDISDSSYKLQREKFIKIYKGTPISELMHSICESTIHFQMTFIEEAIEHVFKIMMQGKRGALSEITEFYITILCYYNILQLILFYHTAKDYIKKTYQVAWKSDEPTDVVIVRNALASSVQHFSDIKAITMFDKINAMKDHIIQGKAIDGSLLPIGHFMNTIPRFYHPDRGWYDAADYSKECIDWVENDIIIGFFQKIENTRYVRRKVRPPKHKMKDTKDSRKIEKGTLCITKSKSELYSLCEKLDIKDFDKDASTRAICHEIFNKLLYLELHERQKGSKLKYFYFFWECQD